MSHSFTNLFLTESFINNFSSNPIISSTSFKTITSSSYFYKNINNFSQITYNNFCKIFNNYFIGDGFIKGVIKEKEVIYPFCTVVLYSLRDFTTVTTTTSDIDGNFYIDNLLKGTTYLLIAIDKNNKYKNIISHTIEL